MSLFTPAIFGDLKNHAKLQQEKGMKMIDLSLGSPDLPPHAKIREHLSYRAGLAESYGYTLTGTQRFYDAVSRYYKRRSNIELNPASEIIQTIGSQEG